MKRTSAASIMVLTACVVAGGAGQSSASTPANGRIVWSRVPSTFDRQKTMSANPDGSERIEVSHPHKHFQDFDPQVSPDGSQVILERDKDDGSVSSVVLVDSDGQNEQTLDLDCIDPCLLDSAPTWTPTVGRIAYTPVLGPFDGPNGAAASAVLQTSELDGANPERLSEPGIDGVYEDFYPRFSPDGSYIVFTRGRVDKNEEAVFRADVDGTHVQRLTPWKLEGDLADLSPATSGPTEDLVAFETYGHEAPPGTSSNIATVPSTCAPVSDCREQIRLLTHHEGGKRMSFNPSWSPDGTRLAYVLFRDKTNNHPCCLGDIYTMNANGHDRMAVSTSRTFEYRPDWGVAP